jgi:hypothetical protein
MFARRPSGHTALLDRMSMSLEERRAHRALYLRAVYDESDGVAGRFVKFIDVGEVLGFDRKHSEELADYLVAEGLLEYVTMGTVALTHWGLKEMEQSLAAPEEPTEHFPSLVIAQNYLQVETMIGSQVQQGTTASQINAGTGGELVALVAEIRAALADLNLSDEQRDQVEVDLTTVEVQVNSPRPKAGVIRESLASARSVLEGALGSGLATTAPHLPALIERVTHVLSAMS